MRLVGVATHKFYNTVCLPNLLKLQVHPGARKSADCDLRAIHVAYGEIAGPPNSHVYRLSATVKRIQRWRDVRREIGNIKLVHHSRCRRYRLGQGWMDPFDFHARHVRYIGGIKSVAIDFVAPMHHVRALP
jgi:hypothetical protein